MPEILADQQAGAPEAGVEGTDRITPGKEPPFIEQAVGGQIHFTMHVHDLSA